MPFTLFEWQFVVNQLNKVSLQRDFETKWFENLIFWSSVAALPA